MADHQHARPRPIPEEHSEEQINPLCHIREALTALGWVAQPVKPGVGTPFTRGASGILVDRGTGLDPSRDWSTAEVRIDLAPPAAPPASASGGRGAPAAARAAPPPHSVVVTFPGGELSTPASELEAGDGGVCLTGSTATLATVGGGLLRAHWKAASVANWYTRGDRRAMVFSPDDTLCLLLNVPEDPVWERLVGDLRRTIERTSPDNFSSLTAEDMMTHSPIAGSPRHP